MDAIESRKKDYEAISTKHDPDYNEILNTIPIIKKYIIDKGFIVYGGTAIDYALRLHGDNIYPDSALAIPDLDFYSYNNIADAYDLADILYAGGCKKAHVIGAMYIYTMRVDATNNHFVADMTYIPREIYDTLPYLKYDGMKIIHPDFQRIDLHKSLANPYTNAPREDMFNRWKKDVVRFNLLDKYYPIEPSNIDAESYISYVSLPETYQKFVLSGMGAYACLLAALHEYSNKYGVKINTDGIVDVSISGGGGNIYLPSLETSVDFISHRPEQMLPADNYETYEPYLSIIPRKYKYKVSKKDGGDTTGVKKTNDTKKDTIHATKKDTIQATTHDTTENFTINISDTSGKLIGVSSYVLSTMSGDITLRHVNIHYLCYQLLGLAHKYTNLRDVYRKLYTSCMRILEESERIFIAIDEGKVKTKDIAKDIAMSSPFVPSIKTYGDENHNETYKRIRDATLHELGLGPRVVFPSGYYPERGNAKPTFDYDQVEAFHISGHKI